MRHALLIALERYDLLAESLADVERSRLAGSLDDMERLARLLQGQDFRIDRRYDGWADRQGIVEGFERLLGSVRAGDTVVVAWAGCGSRVRATGWKRGFRTLLTRQSSRGMDTNGDLFEPELAAWIEALESRTPHITLIFDTSFDRGDSDPRHLRAEVPDGLDQDFARFQSERGEVSEAPAAVRAALDSTDGDEPERTWLDTPGRSARVVLACGPGGRAFEIPHPDDPRRTVGVFGHALLEVLERHDFEATPWEALDWRALIEGPVSERLALLGSAQIPIVHGGTARRRASPDGSPHTTAPSTALTTPQTAGIDATTEERPGRRRALVVGISRYLHLEDLEAQPLVGCINDAQRMAGLLETRGFTVERLFDQRATRSAMVAAMERLVSTSSSDDSVVFVFSGHGSSASRSGEGSRQTLVPYDSGRRRAGNPNLDLFDVELDLWVKRLNRQGVHRVTLIFDSCHSGGASRGLAPEDGAPRTAVGEALGAEDPVPERSEAMAEALAETETRETRGTGFSTTGWTRRGERSATVLTACRSDQLALEKGDARGVVQGVFSRFLGAALERRSTTPWDALDWSIIQGEVMSEDFSRVVEGRQTPQFEISGVALERPLPELERHALVIGIETYDPARGLRPLASAVDDADGLAELLVEHHGYAADRVHRLLDGQATGEAIRAKLAELAKTLEAKNDTALLFFFAGHGEARGEVLAGVEGFLLPHDAGIERDPTWIAMDELRDAFEQLDCRHLLVVLDCCFAGAFNLSRSAPRARALFESQLRRFLEQRAWQVLTSATHNQLARDVGSRPLGRDFTAPADGAAALVGDSPAGQTVHSPFTAALLEGLMGAADAAEDGVITTADLFQHLDGELIDVPGGQMPGLSHFDGRSVGQFIFFTPGREPRPLPDPRLDASDARLPWPGLAPYDEDDHDRFFGRESLLGPILERLAETRPAAPAIVALVATSGAGKTSLLRAGLLPRLRRHYRVCELVPANQGLPTSAAPITNDPAAQTRPLLLVVDGLEALYTQATAEERRDFLDRFAHHLGRAQKALVTARSDVVARFAKQCDRRVETVRLASPGVDALRRIIEGPAETAGLFPEPELVSRLVEAMRHDPWPLATLSTTLDAVYRHAFERWQEADIPDRELRLADLDAIGGLATQLERRADAAYAAEDEAGRHRVQCLFLRLLGPYGGANSKQPLSRGDLAFGEEEDSEKQTAAVIDRWIGHRLLVSDGETVEPCSNALLESWGRLGGWLDEDPALPTLLRDLDHAMTGWWAQGFDEQFLWHSEPRLDALASRQSFLGHRERLFVAASQREREGVRLGRIPDLLSEISPGHWSRMLVFAETLRRSRPEVPVAELTLRRCLALGPLSVPLELELGQPDRPLGEVIALGFVETDAGWRLVVEGSKGAWGWGLEPEELAADPERLASGLLERGAGEVGLDTEGFGYGETRSFDGPSGAVVEVRPGQTAFELRYPDDVPAGFAGGPGSDKSLCPTYELRGLPKTAKWLAFDDERGLLAAAAPQNDFSSQPDEEDRHILLIRLWSLRPVVEEPRFEPLRLGDQPPRDHPRLHQLGVWALEALAFDPMGHWTAAVVQPENGGFELRLYTGRLAEPSARPEEEEPMVRPQHTLGVDHLRKSGRPELRFDPTGRWLVLKVAHRWLDLWAMGAGPESVPRRVALDFFDFEELDRARERDNNQPMGDFVSALAFAPGGRRLALGCFRLAPGRGPAMRSKLLIGDLGERRQTHTLRCSARSVMTLDAEGEVLSELVFDPEGRRIAAIDGANQIRIWDLEVRRSTPVIELPPRKGHLHNLRFVGDRLRVESERDFRKGTVSYALDPAWLGRLARVCAGSASTPKDWDELMTGEPMPTAEPIDHETRVACIRAILGVE